MDISVVTTEDGSHSLFVKDLNEHFHSLHGAIQESTYVYINQGLQHATKNPICITEIGFGTGLNALLTALECEKLQIHCNYVSYDMYPIHSDIYTKLNYPELLHVHCSDLYSQIMNSEWNKQNKITKYFTLTKNKEDITKISSIPSTDLIYFDAFAPNKQAEMWTKEIMTIMYDNLNTQGIFVTYCAKGDVRRILKNLGFSISRLPGPPGKWEMLRAVKV